MPHTTNPPKHEAFLKAVLENLSEGVVACDADGFLTTFNRATRQFHGINEARIPPEKWAEHYSLYHADGVTPLAKAEVPLYRALKGEKIVNVEMVIKSNGQPRTVVCNGEALFDETGEKLGAVVTMHDVSEARRATQELENERRFRTLFEQSPVSVQLLSVEGKTLQVNHAWKELWEIPQEFIENFILKEYNILSDPQLEREGISQYIKQGFEGKTTKIPAIKYDPNELGNPGRARWVEGYVSPVFDERQNVREVVLIHEDVTLRVEAEESLRAAKAAAEAAKDKIRETLDRMPQLIWTTDSTGRATYANLQVHEYCGFDLTGPSLDGWRKFIHPDDARPARIKWVERISAGETYEQEYRLRRHDGEYRWFLGRTVPVKDQNGNILEWLGTATDIHDRKIAEEREKVIRNKVSRLQAIAVEFSRCESQQEIARIVVERGLETIGAAAGIVVLLGDDGRMQIVYARGYRPDTLKRWEECDITSSSLPLVDAIRTGKPILLRSREEIESIYPDLHFVPGQHLSPATAAFPLLVQGRAIGAIGVSFDQEQEYQQQRLDYLTILAEQAAQSLDRTRLFEAEKTARRNAEVASIAKSQFLANMSHEIRTPMNAILGFADLLLDPNASDAERAEYRGRMRANGELLLHLIDDVLDFSRVEAGKLSIESRPFSLLELLQDVKSTTALAAKAKELRVALEIDPAIPPMLVSDPIRLKQILTNMLANATKFTERGSIKISAAPKSPELIAIDIQDTGLGIPSEMQARLFQPFAQGDNSITRKFGGAGLGLVLSRRLAEALGGSLSLVGSELGRGSLFRIEIPKIVPPAPAASAAAQATRSPGAPQITLAGKKVLLVDDAPDNVVLIRTYLRSTGLDIDVASDGVEAVSKAMQATFDLILMDIQMPNMDGLEATRRIRSNGNKVPIAALSAHALAEEVARSLRAGCDVHLTKPISKTALIAEMTRLLTSDRGPEV